VLARVSMARVKVSSRAAFAGSQGRACRISLGL
jgi:hypothetical protein